MKKIIMILCICVFIISGCSNNMPSVSGGKTAEPQNTAQDKNKSNVEDNGVKENKEPPISKENDDEEKQGTNKNSILNGKIICIDPGHGNPEIKGKQEKIAPSSKETKPGMAFGAVGTATKNPEYKINMSVSLKLKSLFEEQGCKIVLTRKSDEENLGNIDRAIIGNEAKSDLVIRIHADGSENQSVKGVSVLYPGSKYISNDEILMKSKSAARFVYDSIVASTGAKPRGIVPRDDLTGFNWSTQPTILIEMGFLSNVEEDKLLNDPLYQDKMAKSILTGVINYFEGQ